MCHKRQRVHNYPLKFKTAVIKCAEIHGNRVAERKFVGDRKRIREWRANKEEIISTARKEKVAPRRRVNGFIGIEMGL